MPPSASAHRASRRIRREPPSEPLPTADDERSAQRYRVDDLARTAGTTVRNVRVYQDRGLLPPPEREGRVGWYSEAHLGRLRLITRLLERGYSLAAIADLVSSWQTGRELTEVLGLEDVLTRPWSDEEAGHTSIAALRKRLGKQATPANVRRAIDLGLLTPERGGMRVPSPRLLEAGVELVAIGIPLATVLDLAAALQRDLTVVARRFVGLVTDRLAASVDGGPATSDDLAELAAVVSRLRPQAQRAVDAVFATSMEREVAEAFGHTAPMIRTLPTASTGGGGRRGGNAHSRSTGSTQRAHGEANAQ
jgi:DNA-binding transcriptional MerR regulator